MPMERMGKAEVARRVQAEQVEEEAVEHVGDRKSVV